ncbi:MAG: accessory factor UbiK family protein [Rhodocyclaceae bacterium]|nr:accessory factor UbiK family protein [Rhodocyclaceae bacterium]
MAVPRLLDELGSRLAELAANSPARDVEKNVRALLSSGFARLDLVTREEFEVQGALLQRAQEKIAELERRVASLEAAAAPGANEGAD